MVNGSAFMLGCGYALYKGAHVRTDIFWENFSERTKGHHRPVSYICLFFPVHDHRSCWSASTPHCIPGTPASVRRRACGAYHVAVPGHHPARGLSCFMIQGVSESLKCWYQIRFGREFEHREKIEV